jgi:hypothetical protein
MVWLRKVVLSLNIVIVVIVISLLRTYFEHTVLSFHQMSYPVYLLWSINHYLLQYSEMPKTASVLSK